LNRYTDIENIEKAIFVNSLENNLNTRALGEIYVKLIQMRHEIHYFGRLKVLERHERRS